MLVILLHAKNTWPLNSFDMPSLEAKEKLDFKSENEGNDDNHFKLHFIDIVSYKKIFLDF